MRTRSRFALSVLLAVVMTIGLVPAPALAEAAEEIAAQGNAATPTEGGGGKTDEKADAPDKDTGAPQKADDGGDAALAPKLQVAAEKVQVEVPVAAEGLAFNGSEQVGVDAGEGYSLSGDAKATDAGEYTATATPADGYEWADGTAEPREIRWSIARRPVTVTADDKSKLAGEADPELTAKVEGTVGDDTVSFTLARAEGDEPGEYAITPTGETEQGNYAVTFVAGKLTVGEAPKAEKDAPGDAGVTSLAARGPEGGPALAAQADGDITASGTWGTCPWEIDSGGTLTVHPGEGASQTYESSPWSSYGSRIAYVVFAQSGDARVVLPAESKGLFHALSKVTSIDLSGCDLSGVKDISGMFSYCSRLSSLDLSGWDTSKVTDMSRVFSGCSSLASLDLSGWDTSSATDMGSMFDGCSSLASLDLSGWDTKSVTDMGSMFDGCSSLETIDVSSWTLGSVVPRFSGCSKLREIAGISGWDTKSVADMGSMFDGCSSLASLDLSGWDTKSVADMSRVFSGCSSLASLDLSGWDTKSVTDMGSMFDGCSSLETIDVSSWTLGSVVPRFSGCSKLREIAGISGWDTKSVADMS